MTNMQAGYIDRPYSNHSYVTVTTNYTNSTTSAEWTPPDPPYDPWVIALLATLASIVSICTTLGNIMVVISFIMEKGIRQPSNYLIASLAVTDIIIGSSSMPLYTAYLLKAYWPLNDFICDLWLSLDYTVCLVSQYTVFLITLDRFCSVTVPTRYRSWRTATKMKVMIFVTWFVPALIFFSSIMGWHHFNAEDRYEHECMAMFQESKLFSAILVICYYWVTLVIMIGLYVGIYRVALSLQKRSRAAKKRIAQHSKGNASPSLAREKERLLSSSEMTPGMTSSTDPATSTETNNVSGLTSKKSDEIMTAMANNVANLLIVKQGKPSMASNHLTLPDIKVCPPTSQHKLTNGRNTDINNGQLQPNDGSNDAESPIWKPRSSLPNSSIHWDAFTGETYVKVDSDCNEEKNGETTQMSRSPSLSPKVGHGRHSKRRKRSQRNPSRSDYIDDSSSETSESDHKPKGLSQLSGLVSSIAPSTPTKAKTERKRMTAKKKSENRARKALRTITFILGAFVVCWTPYHVIVLVQSFCESCKIPPILSSISYWLCYMNSPLNPFCYALSSPQFKKSFIKILDLTYLRNCWRKLRGH